MFGLKFNMSDFQPLEVVDRGVFQKLLDHLICNTTLGRSQAILPHLSHVK